MLQSENFPIMSYFSLWQQRIWKLGSRYIWLLSLMTKPEISLLRKFWITGEAVFRYWILYNIFFDFAENAVLHETSYLLWKLILLDCIKKTDLWSILCLYKVIIDGRNIEFAAIYERKTFGALQLLLVKYFQIRLVYSRIEMSLQSSNGLR